MQFRSRHVYWFNRSRLEKDWGMQSKIRELGIFSIGLGVIGASFLVLFRVLQDSRSGSTSALDIVLLSGCAVLVALGVLTIVARKRAVIWLTVAVLVVGLTFDLLLVFSVMKLATSGFIIWLVVRTGFAAIEEVSGVRGTDPSTVPIKCSCGNVLAIRQTMAGSQQTCEAWRSLVQVPSLTELQRIGRQDVP